jgi:hypothetical protein
MKRALQTDVEQKRKNPTPYTPPALGLPFARCRGGHSAKEQTEQVIVRSHLQQSYARLISAGNRAGGRGRGGPHRMSALHRAGERRRAPGQLGGHGLHCQNISDRRESKGGLPCISFCGGLGISGPQSSVL